MVTCHKIVTTITEWRCCGWCPLSHGTFMQCAAWAAVWGKPKGIVKKASESKSWSATVMWPWANRWTSETCLSVSNENSTSLPGGYKCHTHWMTWVSVFSVVRPLSYFQYSIHEKRISIVIWIFLLMYSWVDKGSPQAVMGSIENDLYTHMYIYIYIFGTSSSLSCLRKCWASFS